MEKSKKIKKTKQKKQIKNTMKSKGLHILSRTAKTYTKKLTRSRSLKSYSPSINLKYKKERPKRVINLFSCNSEILSKLNDSIDTVGVKKLDKDNYVNLKKSINVIKLNINSKKQECYPIRSSKAMRAMLHNIHHQPKLKIRNLVAPTQILANCWFNTFFVSFFISDKGRKFFKSFRELMVTGKTKEGNHINTNLKASLLLLNYAIEASYNYFGNSGEIAKKIDTNHLISFIYNSLPKDKQITDGGSDIKNVTDAGNPIKYYQTIISYLDGSHINMSILNQLEVQPINEMVIQEEVSKEHNIPHIIVLELWEDYKHDKQEKYTISYKGTTVTYRLDSIIIRTTNGEHFGSVITCNKQELAFDGASLKKLSPFKWKSLINKDKNWSFKSDYYDHNEYKWNFKNGYQMMFYYRV